MPIQYPPDAGNLTQDPGIFQKLRMRKYQQDQMAAQQQRSQLENALLQTQIGQIGQQKPMSSLDQARQKLIEAQTGQVGQPTQDSGSSELARVKASLLKEFLDPNTPPERKKQIQGSGVFGGSTVNVTTNLPGTEKSTKGSMEKSIIEAQKSVLGLDIMDRTFKEEYTQYPFQARSKLSSGAEKLGIPLPEDEGGILLTKEQLGDKAAWERQAEEAFLTFRKWATGVAGGEKEMAAIRQAFATKDKSATEFRAMIKQAKDFQSAYVQSLENMLMAGSVLSKETKARAAEIATQSSGISQQSKTRTTDQEKRLQELKAKAKQ